MKTVDNVNQTIPIGIRETLKANQFLKLSLPVWLGALLWIIHKVLPNQQIYNSGAVFNKTVAGLIGLYIIFWISAVFHRPIRAGLEGKSPLIAAGVVFLILWELVTLKSGWLPLPFFPSPGAIVAVFVMDWQTLIVSAFYSLRLLAIGYFIGAVLGLPIGILMGWSPQVNYWVTPILRFIGPIPATAWIPVAMVAFPTSFSASVFLVALSCWFPVTVMTWSGVSNVSKSYYEVAKTLGADEMFLIVKVAVPAAMPSIFVGLFMGLGTAFVTLVVGELLGVKAGLGWYIQWAQGWAEYVKVYAALIVMAVLFSGIITYLFKFRDRILVWQKGLIKW
jgi:NitT/TauT family transport system permease protein